MLMAASRALADCSPLATDGHGALLPNIDDIQGVSKCIAIWKWVRRSRRAWRSSPPKTRVESHRAQLLAAVSSYKRTSF